ncbi:hypothetical protein R3P38DRAFT_3171860 [Favolaschia claudopus]|uniref:Uncharacterized protein n=1 Tax=Favolaschia claudopus TaxID=2862362 RepID=A0AAW0DTE5_9AGAR
MDHEYKTTAEDRWQAFCHSAHIEEHPCSDDLLVVPESLPSNLPTLITESLVGRITEKVAHIPVVQLAQMDALRTQGKCNLVEEDPHDFQGNMHHLCRLYSKFMVATTPTPVNPKPPEALVRRAVDDLFELVFQTSRHGFAYYAMESKVNVVKYDHHNVRNGPKPVATADGAVLLSFHDEFKILSNLGDWFVGAGPELSFAYALSYVEFKGGLNNNGRQAILDGAALQAVHHAWGLPYKSYSFSVHHTIVDVIISWWVPSEDTADPTAYSYRYFRRDNWFALNEPLGWFKFYAFLCRLRTYHSTILEHLRRTSPARTARQEDLFHQEGLHPIPEGSGGGGGASHDADQLPLPGFSRDTEMTDKEMIATGEDAFSGSRQVSVEEFCQGGDSDESDEEDERCEDEENVKFSIDIERLHAWRGDVPDSTLYSQYYRSTR